MAEFGEPIALERSGGWLLRRPIPGTSWYDAIAPYPFLVCQDWRALATDLAELESDLVSVSAAPDPFGNYGPDELKAAFPDHLVPFKEHFFADLSVPEVEGVGRKHRKQGERALQNLEVKVCPQPREHLDEWISLFDPVIVRFGLRGMRAFSREAFERHFALPGVTMTRAMLGDRTLAAHVLLQHDGVAYAHLAAHRPEARDHATTYALYLFERRYFTGRARAINWGGVAGVSGDSSGLSAFKRSWSTGTQPAYFAGRILDRQRYVQLSERLTDPTSRYFPAYRAGEFG